MNINKSHTYITSGLRFDDRQNAYMVLSGRFSSIKLSTTLKHIYVHIKIAENTGA